MDRRDFLKFMGMASSAAVLSSCGVEYSVEKIHSRLVTPEDEDYLPGEPMYRSTTCSECGSGCGVTVKLVDYNPIKVDGNKAHPVNAGATCLRCQASLIRLYHPRRLQSPMRREGDVYIKISWDEAYRLINDAMNAARTAGKKNVYLSGRTTGTLSQAIAEFCAGSGTERLPEYEPNAYNTLRHANKLLFGQDALPEFRIDKADFLLTLGADVVETFVSPISQARQINKARHEHHLHWVHAEPHASLSGFKADERLTIKPGSESFLLAFLIRSVDSSQQATRALSSAIMNSLPVIDAARAAAMTGLSQKQVEHLAHELTHRKSPLVIAGGVSTSQRNGLETAVLAGLLQWMTGMTNDMVDFTNGQDYSGVGSTLDLRTLTDRLHRNEIGVLFVSRSEPLGTYPGYTGLAAGMQKAGLTVCMTDFLLQELQDGDFMKEYRVSTPTAAACDLVLPLSNGYESWGDVQTHRGLTGLMKPVLKPLYDSRTEGDILLKLSNPAATTTWADRIQQTWKNKLGEQEYTRFVQEGFVKTSAPVITAGLNAAAAVTFLTGANLKGSGDATVLYAVTSARMGDGRSKVLPLLTEIPDALTTINYGSWVSISDDDYAEMNLNTHAHGYHKPHVRNYVEKKREIVKVSVADASVKVPAMAQAGMPKGVATMYRDQIDPAMLTVDPRTGECLAEVAGVTFDKTGDLIPLSISAGQMTQDANSAFFHGERPIVTPDHSHPHDPLHDEPFVVPEHTLYPTIEYKEYKWQMVIDMDSCTGCSACVAACYIENNIPVVGERESLNGREMSWLRLQPYYSENGSMESLLMLCQHCDNAPCENVCPVYATYHNPEGLNVMVYNRCVGTRYCHNNCPYKVRRFNWFDWTDEGYWAEPMSRMSNPDMWVRPKGIMEKCTFCVQRIRRAKDVAKDESRMVQDGDFTTACAQACPTNAITFGNALDKNSQVYKKAQSDLAFRVLTDNGTNMGVSPAVHYLRSKEEHA